MSAPIQRYGVTADGAVNRGRLQIVGSTARTVAQAADGAAPYAGVAEYDAADGAAVQLQTPSGPQLIEAGAVVAIGAEIMADSVGRGITATTTNYTYGVAMEAAAAAGDFILVMPTSGGLI